MRTIIYFLFLTFLTAGILSAQQRQISGTVKSDKGNPLAGVTVMVKGTAVGTYTKSDGSFKLTVPKDAKILIFKLIGMKSKEVNIVGEDVVNVQLEEDKVMMDEVVVTAIGLERDKKTIGYAMEEVSGTRISESKAINVVNAINGKVAGVQITNSSGAPGSASYITIRGVSSITGNSQPLFVVDGIPIDNSQSYSGNPDDGRNNLLYGVAYSNRAIDLNPDDIESISILKGPAATALYGLRAASGAIIITTKKGSSTAAGEKINISFTSSIGMEEVNKKPELQTTYAQGRRYDTLNKKLMGQKGFDFNNSIPFYRGPETGEPLSWGPKISDLSRDGDATYKWDKNGKIVLNTDPNAKTPATAYNNFDNFFTTGSTWTNSLSMTGGTDWGTFFLSISNASSSGIIPNSSFDRTTVRIAGDAMIATKLKASGSFEYINSGGTRIQQGSNTSGVMLGLLRTPPTFDNSNGFGKDAPDNPASYMFPDGSQRTYRGGGGYDNPFWTVERNPFTDNVDRFIGHIQLNWYIFDWMDIMYRLGGDIYSDIRKQEFSINSRTAPAGQVFNHDITSTDLTQHIILNFNYKFSEDLSSRLLLGNDIYYGKSTSLYVQGDGLIIPDFYHISNTAGQMVRQGYDRLRRAAFLGDLTLEYMEWLYFNFSLRNEWSTTLPKDNNSFLYGQGNISLIFTNLFKDLFSDSPLTFGKVRFNYAVAGKDAPLYGTTTPFTNATYADGWTTGISFPFLQNVGFMKSDILGSDILKPEKTTSFEFGLALNFLDNLFGIDFTYYQQRNVDQIFDVPVANETGFWRALMNAGELENKGFEIVLNANPLNMEGFRWDINLNFASNKNKVVKLAENVDQIFIGGFEGSSIRAVKDQPYGSIYGFGWLRDASGNIVINDDPNDAEYGFPILDVSTEKAFGSSLPDWTMGITNSLSLSGESWGAINFSFLIDIRQGGVMWNGTKGALYYFGTHKDTEIRGTKKVFSGVKGHYDANGNLVTAGNNDLEVTLDDRWLAFGNGNGFYGSNTEDFIEKTSWIRLREVNLSYLFPSSVVNAIGFLSELGFTVTGRNLWLSTDYSGIDPETNLMGAHNAQGLDYFNMPGTRSYIFSINVKF